jgi:hypothetical protein
VPTALALTWRSRTNWSRRLAVTWKRDIDGTRQLVVGWITDLARENPPVLGPHVLATGAPAGLMGTGTVVPTDTGLAVVARLPTGRLGPLRHDATSPLDSWSTPAIALPSIGEVIAPSSATRRHIWCRFNGSRRQCSDRAERDRTSGCSPRLSVPLPRPARSCTSMPPRPVRRPTTRRSRRQLRAFGVEQAMGFSLNVGGIVPTEESTVAGLQL